MMTPENIELLKRVYRAKIGNGLDGEKVAKANAYIDRVPFLSEEERASIKSLEESA